MRLAFWASALFIAYVYVGYALLLMLWVRLRRRPALRSRVAVSSRSERTGDKPWNRGGHPATAALPRVSIVIAARNEGRRLRTRIANLLALDYPADRRQIIVASDGSTDDTRAALAAFGSQVELVEIPPAGKVAALNAGVM